MPKNKAPVFTTLPTISPVAGTVGTTFRASDGLAKDASTYSRRWLLSGISIGTGTSVAPAKSGSLVLEVTATGRFGSSTARSSTVTVASAPPAAPVFTTLPFITPTAGLVGDTYRASDGLASNASTYSRRWLLSGAPIGGGTSVVPTSSGSLVLEVTATGTGGSTIARSSTVTVAPAPTSAPVFTTPPTVTPTSGAVGDTFRASDGVASNASSYSRRWLMSGISIGTGTSVVPTSSGSLILEVTATGPGGSTISKASTVTIAQATPSLKPGTLSIAGVSRSEGGAGSSYFDLTVTRPTDSTGPAGATWTRVLNGSADASDFVANSPTTGTVSFADGQFAATIRIAVQGDSVPEPDESFSVQLSNPTDGATLGVTGATVTIVNDDTALQLTASSATYNGVTYNFSEPRPVRQYPTGDYRVLAPVTIVSTSIPSVQVSGGYSDWTGTYSNKWAHGMEINPGNRAHVGGLTASNAGNPKQGLVEIPENPASSLVFVPYSHDLNVDPGAKGPLVLTGPVTLYKGIARDGQDGRPHPSGAMRPGQYAASKLTVVDDLGPDDALPPGTAQADKTHYFTERDWDVAIFANKPKVVGAETADAICARLLAPWPMQATDQVNAPTLGTLSNGHDGYPRVPARNVAAAAAALVCDYTADEKRKILNHLWPIAVDAYARAKEGGDPVGSGGALSGGNGAVLRKAAMSMCFAALHNANTLPGAQTKLADMVSTCQAWLWPEDKMIAEATPKLMSVPRSTSTSRPVDELPQWTQNAHDWNCNAGSYNGMGTNHDGQYRTVAGEAGTIGALAVLATPLAKAVWGRHETLEYHKSYIHLEMHLGRYGIPGGVSYNGVSGASSPYTANKISAFDRSVIKAILPSDPVPPAPVFAKVKGSTLWIHFDKNLDETTAVLPSSYVVKKNGAVVSGVTIPPRPVLSVRDDPQYVPDEGYVSNGIWRDNVGLILPTPCAFGDTYSVEYLGGTGANRLRSVLDQVNVAPFTISAVENLTESIGGANAAYPVVRFDKNRPDTYELAVAGAIASANSPRFTLWLPHVKLTSLPPATVELFGYAGNTPAFELYLLPSGALRITVRDIGLSQMATMTSAPLPLDRATSVRMDYDAEDISKTTGWNCFLNGVSAKGSDPTLWKNAAGKTIKWTQSLTWKLGGSSSSAPFDGEFGGMWLNTSQRVSDPAQVAKFTSANNGNLSIGTLGEGITGTPPSIFIVGNAAQYNNAAGINRGTGPKFFLQSGGVTDVVADPASQALHPTQWL